MKSKFLFFIIFFLYSGLILAQQELKIKLELADIENVIDQKTGKVVPTAYLGNRFRVKVIINGSGRDSRDVKIVGLENLNVEGKNQSMSITGHNGRFVTDITYIYDIYADKLGTFTIGPAQIEQKGKIIRSEPNQITFNIVKEKGGRVVRSGVVSDVLQAGIPVSDRGYELFCKLNVDKKNVVVGEPIVLSIKTYSKGNIVQVGIESPKFPNFLSQEIKQVSRQHENVEGKLYDVIEKKYVLLPTKTGQLQIDPVKINFNVQIETKRRRNSFFDDDFFSGFLGQRLETKRAISNDLQIKVDSLPAFSEFVDGIGKFTKFSVEADKNEAMINEAILLSVEIEGKGNLDQVVAPKLNLPDFFNSYESKTDLQQDLTTGFVGGKKRFEFVLQVARSGEWNIPEQKFTYFDTESSTYKTLKTEPIKLSIKRPPPGQYRPVDAISALPNKDEQDKAVKEFEKDIHFIEDDVFNVVKRKERQISFWMFLMLLLLPMLLFPKKILSFLGFLKLHEKILNKFASKKSLSKFKKDLEQIIKNGEVLRVYQIFLNYFATKFNIDIDLISEDWIEKKLIDLGWETQKINDFLNYLSQCASLYFAAGAKMDIDNKKLLEKSRYWFFMLESKS